jgi:hypothetical protein
VHSGSNNPQTLAYIEAVEVLKTLNSPEAWIRAIKMREGFIA